MNIENVYVITPNRNYRCAMELSELENHREDLARLAGDYMRSLPDKPDHLIYYRDKRDEQDNITEAWLYYDFVPLTNDEYYDRTAKINGTIGALHSLHIMR